MNTTLGGLSDGTFRARWLKELLRTPHVTESVKSLLLAIGLEDMDEAGRFSVPREELAVRISRGNARISERLTAAVEAGVIARISTGKKGSTAVYVGLLNGSACSDPIGESEAAGKGPAIRTESEHFGSGLQDAEPESMGSPNRTRTNFGSGLQDALEDETVRTAGPNDAKKGPPNRDANVEGYGGIVDPSPSGSDEDFLKIDEAGAAPPKRSRSKAASPEKIPCPADFAVTPEMRTWAASKAPLVDVDLETELFVRHWTDKPLVKRPGWVRTWETWLLRQQSWAQQRGAASRPFAAAGTSTPRAPRPSTTDDRVAAAQALKAKYRTNPPTPFAGEIA